MDFLFSNQSEQDKIFIVQKFGVTFLHKYTHIALFGFFLLQISPSHISTYFISAVLKQLFCITKNSWSKRGAGARGQ